MNGVWALIPVKTLLRAKTRLASILQPQECASLSRAMLMDVLAALDGAQHIERIAVLTNDSDIASMAAQLGHTVIADESDGGLCDSLNKAARELAARGATTLLIMPGDIPTVRAQDIDELLERHTGGLSICPASRDGGTNALVCTPPDALPFQFGPDSARRHLETAEQHKVPATRLTLQAYLRDIDTPDDLVWLAQQDAELNTVRFLHEAGIVARLVPNLKRASA